MIEGVEIYCPRIRFRKVTRRGPVWFLEALFPGYSSSFSLHPPARCGEICLRGYRDIAIRQAGNCGRQRCYRVLRSRTGWSDDIPVIDINPSLDVGDSVNIADGAFCGLESVVTHLLSGKDRVRILIDFLGRQIEAEVSRTSVVHVGSPRAAV